MIVLLFFNQKLLHLSYGNSTARADADTALAENALGRLIRVALGIGQLEDLLRAGVYTFLATSAFLVVDCDNVHLFFTSLKYSITGRIFVCSNFLIITNTLFSLSIKQRSSLEDRP